MSLFLLMNVWRIEMLGNNRLLKIATIVLVAVTGVVSPAYADMSNRGGSQVSAPSSSGSVSANEDGSVSMIVEAQFVSVASGQGGSDGSTNASTATRTQFTAYVHPVCWYDESLTGAKMFTLIESHEDDVLTKDQLKDVYKGYGNYANDSEGHWYQPVCHPKYYSGDDPEEYDVVAKEYLDANDFVYVPAGGSPPEPAIDGETLARAAWDSVTILLRRSVITRCMGVWGRRLWVWIPGCGPPVTHPRR
ncbi:hypothetical protein [Actinomyces ruminis]|uniref:hypothetical protein n=1 Tax=Actinomyces ruminis TaxID=1937003 RepID=UPI001178A6B0|nr:hypothetical protein [Actinomyces ruminis]